MAKLFKKREERKARKEMKQKALDDAWRNLLAEEEGTEAYDTALAEVERLEKLGEKNSSIFESRVLPTLGIVAPILASLGLYGITYRAESKGYILPRKRVDLAEQPLRLK